MFRTSLRGLFYWGLTGCVSREVPQVRKATANTAEIKGSYACRGQTAELSPYLLRQDQLSRATHRQPLKNGVGWLMEVAWPGGARQRWVARVGDRGSEPLPLEEAKKAAPAT
jgi:hypothetical protein